MNVEGPAWIEHANAIAYLVSTYTPPAGFVSVDEPKQPSVTVEKRYVYHPVLTVYDSQLGTGKIIQIRWETEPDGGQKYSVGMTIENKYLVEDYYSTNYSLILELVDKMLDKQVPDKGVRSALQWWVRDTIIKVQVDPEEAAKAFKGAAVAAKHLSGEIGSLATAMNKFQHDLYESAIEWSGDGKPYKPKYHGVFEETSNDVSIAKRARHLPATTEMVQFPCPHGNEDRMAQMGFLPKEPASIYEVVIHLNDNCKWDREKIADWLDDLHDTGQINIEFDPWKESE